MRCGSHGRPAPAFGAFEAHSERGLRRFIHDGCLRVAYDAIRFDIRRLRCAGSDNVAFTNTQILGVMRSITMRSIYWKFLKLMMLLTAICGLGCRDQASRDRGDGTTSTASSGERGDAKPTGTAGRSDSRSAVEVTVRQGSTSISRGRMEGLWSPYRASLCVNGRTFGRQWFMTLVREYGHCTRQPHDA